MFPMLGNNKRPFHRSGAGFISELDDRHMELVLYPGQNERSGTLENVGFPQIEFGRLNKQRNYSKSGRLSLQKNSLDYRGDIQSILG